MNRSDLHPVKVIDSLEGLSKRLKVISGYLKNEVGAGNDATRLFNIHLRSLLSSKRAIIKERLTEEGFE